MTSNLKKKKKIDRMKMEKKYHSAAWHFELTCFKFGFSSHRPVLAVAACLSEANSSRKNLQLQFSPQKKKERKIGQNDLEDPLGLRGTTISNKKNSVLTRL